MVRDERHANSWERGDVVSAETAREGRAAVADNEAHVLVVGLGSGEDGMLPLLELEAKLLDVDVHFLLVDHESAGV